METIDVWVNCFYGSVDHLNRRLCQYDEHYGTAECDRECPFYMTKRDAIDFIKRHHAIPVSKGVLSGRE